MYFTFSFLCVILVFVVSRVPRFLFLFCPTRMGHGWTIVGCDFFLPPLGAPPVIFKPEDSTELTSPHLKTLWNGKKKLMVDVESQHSEKFRLISA